MRRILLLAIGVLALALAAPSGAVAHHGHGKHHGKHHKHKKAHRAKFRFKHIGALPAHHDPGAPAGTVASFTGGVLTITLADGSAVSGKVTDRTEIECWQAVAPPAPTATASHHGRDDGQGGEDWGHHGWDDDHHGCHGDADCDASDLVPGAVVQEAELRISSDGAEFKEIKLVTPSA